MISIIKLEELGTSRREEILKRGEKEVEKAKESAKKILEDVKERGDKALIEYTKKFDGIDLEAKDLKVSEKEIDKAIEKIDYKLLGAIKRAYKNIKRFHEKQLPKDWRIEIERGIEAGRRVIPLDRAGLYVPGGKAVYPSVMLMLAIPARIAGVGEIIVCTPPQEKGKIDPASLVVAKLCGVDAVFKVGGIQAIAAMAYGTETIPKVDVIAGPGGPYVSAAQRLVRDEVRLDFPPGPSEGMVIADKFANPKFVAADVLSEAEHGPDSAGVLVTNSLDMADAVKIEFERMLEDLSKPRKDYVDENLKKYSCIILTKSMGEAIDFVNEYAPEHLVIQTVNPEETMEKIKNAGTYCLGSYSPITAGNFAAGPNAILPTGGFGRFVSGVSIDTFVKKPTVEVLSEEGLEKLKEAIVPLSDFEGFPAHSNSVKVRFEDD